ncbi:MAG: PPC domain-containing protein [Cyanobacteriota bacterium]|nr:PPC domain-containing protein [Cyanobacteriota bacterium]
MTTLAIVLSSVRTQAQDIYNPILLPSSGEISDTLTVEDIPTGQGGFARDYLVELQDGDQITIDVTSDSFDTIVSLMTPDGLIVSENDDGPDGSTNSLLFTRINSGGTYTIRVRAFGETGDGPFNLKVTRLRPVANQ